MTSTYRHNDTELGVSKMQKVEEFLGNVFGTSVTLDPTGSVVLAPNAVVSIGGTPQTIGSKGALFVDEATTAPTGSLTSGILLYVTNGSLVARGSAGTTTVLAAP